MESVVCTHCRQGNSEDNRYCAECGAPLPVLCLSCGRDNDRHLGTCECCGRPHETRPLAACRDCGKILEDPLLAKPRARRRKGCPA